MYVCNSVYVSVSLTSENKKFSYQRDSAHRPHKPYIAKKAMDSPGYIFVVASMGLASVNLIHMAPKAAILCEIMQNDGHSGSPIFVPVKSIYMTSC